MLGTEDSPRNALSRQNTGVMGTGYSPKAALSRPNPLQPQHDTSQQPQQQLSHDQQRRTTFTSERIRGMLGEENSPKHAVSRHNAFQLPQDTSRPPQQQLLHQQGFQHTPNPEPLQDTLTMAIPVESRIKERILMTFTVIGTGLTITGFITQFIGVRGSHYLVVCTQVFEAQHQACSD